MGFCQMRHTLEAASKMSLSALDKAAAARAAAKGATDRAKAAAASKAQPAAVKAPPRPKPHSSCNGTAAHRPPPKQSSAGEGPGKSHPAGNHKVSAAAQPARPKLPSSSKAAKGSGATGKKSTVRLVGKRCGTCAACTRQDCGAHSAHPLHSPPNPRAAPRPCSALAAPTHSRLYSSRM